MLTNNMSLRQMIDFKPNDEDMALLPLDVTVYVKVTAISKDKNTNYDFIRYFFADEETSRLFKDLNKTIFYDFDATEVKNSGKFLTLFELYAYDSASSILFPLKEILDNYNHNADIFLDLYTFDNKIIRLSDVDGIVSAENVISAWRKEKEN